MNQQPIKNRFPWKLALPLYALSYGAMLLFSKAHFWDDWLIYYSKSAAGTKDALRQVGYWPINGIFQVDVLGRRPELFAIVTIACFFFTGWCLFHILSTVKILNTEQVRLITILFLVLPINSARVSMSVFVYSYSIFLFYLAWYLLVTKRSRFVWLLSIPLFLLSFNTVALVAFFAVPCLHLLYMKLSVPVANKRIAYVSSALFATLAPLYWIIDRRYNPPQGAYLTMYTPQKLGMLRALLLLFACAGLIFWFLKSHRGGASESKRYAVIIAGITITAIGASPYIVGGHLVDISDWLIAFVPRSSDWDSRHQLLLGLGLSVTIAGVVGSIDSSFKRQSLAVIFGLCVLWNVTYMQSYYLDSLKQDQIVVALRKSDDLKNSRIIMIDDSTERFNARGRFYRSYEWEGILSKAFGENSISVISGKSYVDCGDPMIPETLLTITARNGRLESTVTRDLGIELSVKSIQPCK
mgnify:CR=1 FL=1